MSNNLPGMNDQADSGPPDALHHNEFARSICDHVVRLSPGAVIAVTGPWGRGKTDVLERIIRHVQSTGQSGQTRIRAVLRLNPWQSRNADLLTPLANQMATLLGDDKCSLPEIVKALRGLLLV